MIGQILEAAMLICFGLSWPLNAYKNYKAATAAGTSWQFILLITVGYLAGIAAKFASGDLSWVLIVYFLNLACLAVNWAVYFRNRRLDEARLERVESHAETIMSVKKVLVATDGSKASLEAIGFASHAIDLTHAGQIELLAVAEPGSKASRERANAALTAAGELLTKRGVKSVAKIREGEPTQSIVSEAREGEASIVVMGSRGLSGLKELILGSVSKGVSENVSCPVLIVK